jgi:hypothetical protein
LIDTIDNTPGQGKLRRLAVTPSDNTIEAAIMLTRVNHALVTTGCCALNVDGEAPLILKLDELSTESRGTLIALSKIVRKLKYVEEVFRVRFSLADVITAQQALTVEMIFRGVTEGEFVMRVNEITIPGFRPEPPPDLNKPPFEGPGRFSYIANSPFELFGQQLPLGPVIIVLEKCEVANPRTLDLVRERWDRPVDLRFILYDHQVSYRFEDFTDLGQEHLTRMFQSFEQDLASNEVPELARLASEPLTGPVTSREAVSIATAWQIYNGFPDRYCPQDPVIDDSRGCWRVPIDLVYATGDGGPVGELFIDRVTGEILDHTPVEEIRSRGRLIADSLPNVR